MYRIGIDAGSKTVKMVVADEDGHIVHYFYGRHRSHIRRTLTAMISDFIKRYGNFEGTVALTGSAGISVAKATGLPFVQEVVATTAAVRASYPQADAFIELGGEDAKVVYLTGKPEQRMNATCAGGTGGFIDTIAFMLGVRTAEMDQLARRATHVHPIASRCAVFAQTDVRPLLNTGASKEDMAASTLEAIVRQTLGGLACGRPIRGTVVFLGGPFAYLPELAQRFRTALNLTKETGIRPERAQLFTALGAALESADAAAASQDPTVTAAGEKPENYLTLHQLYDRITYAPKPEDDLPHLPPLFASEQERSAFNARHAQAAMPRTTLFQCRGPLYLGLDAGSTTIKCALVTEDGKLAYSDYRPASGNVLETALSLVEDLYRLMPPESDAYLAQSTVIGYGDEMLRAALRVDSDVVETVAHLRAAQAFCPDVTFVLDIGGQDMKALWVENGQIVDAVLNEACSSGCGSFVEGIAHSLYVTPQMFGEEACRAKNPLDLGNKCTVFMTSRVRHAQKTGAYRTDIAAGIAYSVVQNVLYRVIGKSRVSSMGPKVVVQGGTFKSDAVLRAFELLSGTEAIRPDTAPLMGAIGAALIARDRAAAMRVSAGDEQARIVSDLISPEELEQLEPVYAGIRCSGCSNGCSLSVVSFGDGRSFVNGNQCARGLEAAEAMLQERSESNGGSQGPALPRAMGRMQRHSGHSQHTRAMGAGAIGPAAAVTMGAASKNAERKPARKVQIVMPSHAGSAAGVKAPNLMDSTRREVDECLGRRGRGPCGNMRLGIVPAFFGEELLPFWAGFWNFLGFQVQPLPSLTPKQPQENECVPVALAQQMFEAYASARADVVFLPRYKRGLLCPSAEMFAENLGETAAADPSGPLLASPILQSILPYNLARNDDDLAELLRAVQAIAPQANATSNLVLDAVRYAHNEQVEFEKHLAQRMDNALARARSEGHRGLIIGARPCQTARMLMSGLDAALDSIDEPVITSFAFEMYQNRTSQEHSHHGGCLTNGAVFAGRSGGDIAWRPSERLVDALRFVKRFETLDVMALTCEHCDHNPDAEVSLAKAFASAQRPWQPIALEQLTDKERTKGALEALEAANTQARAQRLKALKERAELKAQEAAQREEQLSAESSTANDSAAPAPPAEKAAWSGMAKHRVSSPQAHLRQRAKDAPNVIRFQQERLAAFKTQDPEHRKLVIGLPRTLESYETTPFWHTLFSQLGFGVRVASTRQSTAQRNMAAESIPSESVCEAAKLSHARLFELQQAGVDAVFLPRYRRGSRCPVLCGYTDALMDSVEFLREGRLQVLAPELAAFLPAEMTEDEEQRAIFEALQGLIASANAGGSAAAVEPIAADEFAQAFRRAKEAYEAFAQQVEDETDRALAWVHAGPAHHGIVVAGRPYHVDPALIHGIDKVVQQLGMAVLSPLGLRSRAEELEVRTGWEPAEDLLRLARYVAGDDNLDLVMLQSFGCGFDAVSLKAVRSYLTSASHGFASLKIDEIIDTAHIRIRLRTLFESIEVRKDRTAAGGAAALADQGEEGAASKLSRSAALPDLPPAPAGADAASEPLFGFRPLDARTLETARSSAPADTCFTAAALMAHVINRVEDCEAAGGDPARLTLGVPRVCTKCITDALPSLVASALGEERVPRIIWEEAECTQLCAPCSDCDESCSLSTQDKERPVRIGIVGNPLLCFDPFMNEHLEAMLRSLGAEPVWPRAANLYTDDVRYLEQMEEFASQGVSAVLYLQSFGCLKGHVQARGFSSGIAQRFPNMPVTVLDYDPESSALNRENRVRLVVSAARKQSASE